jgi:virulence factor Mce-like protein
VGFVLSCVIVLVYLWIDFGGTIPLAARGYRIEVAFPQANELATGADVRIAGVNVGKVVQLNVDRQDTRTLATLEIDGHYAPIPRDTLATLRIKTLLGETYVGLSTGDRSGGPLPDGGRLPDAQVQPDVTLDEILSTFDPKTRAAFKTWMEAQAGALAGRGEDINATFGELPSFIDSAQRLLAVLHHQSAAVRGLVANTGTFFSAVSARRGELSGLITAADHLFATTAQRNHELADVFRALPAFERQSQLVLPALTTFAQQADPVIRGLEPIAGQLNSTFNATATLAPQFRALFERLGPVVTASQHGLPALDQVLHHIPPLLGAFVPFLRNGDAMVRYIGQFKQGVAGFFANTTAASEASNLSPPRASADQVRYLRATQTLTPSGLALLPRELGIARDNAYRSPTAFNQLSSGLTVLDAGQCSNGNPAQPTTADPPSLVALIKQYVYRTNSRNAAAPPCRSQGPVPGYSTLFPQLTADPPPR